MKTKATFLDGSILKHVVIMSATNAIGLSAIFLVDLVDIYFISLLENSIYTAAIGYASAITLFATAISVALTIANSAIVSKCIGENNTTDAKRYVTHLAVVSITLTAAIAAIVWIYASSLLAFMGAKENELAEAVSYLRIIIPSLPILALSMQMNTTLRCLGDGKRAMYSTLFAAGINAFLDPIFIFMFAMDLQGAAIASLLARICALGIGMFYVISKYKMLTTININVFIADLQKIIRVVFPAMLTQLATPLGTFYVIYEMAKFGTDYLTGWVIVGRIIPVVFCIMYSISGAIGPIIGQNYGAQNLIRVREVLHQSIKFITAYCLVVSMLLSFGQEILVSLFNAKGEAAQIIRIFCQHIAITFIATGFTFIAIAFLNNLGFSKFATILNIGKCLLGIIPCVTIGAFYYHAPGILYGLALGNIIFAVFALLLTHVVLTHVERNNDQPSNN